MKILTCTALATALLTCSPSLLHAADPVFRITEVSNAEGLLVIRWADGTPPFQVQSRSSLDDPWENQGAPTDAEVTSISMDASQAYFRVVQEQIAQYTLNFDADWTRSTHPEGYPANPHFSGLVGGTHGADVIFWRTNQLASLGVKNVAETGNKTALIAEVNSAITAGSAEHVLSGSGIGTGTGEANLNFEISRDYPLVSIVSMLAPSPDWFVGVDSLSLLDDEGQWRDEIVIPLFLFDAGTDSGPTYGSPNQVTTPFANTTLIEGFPALVDDALVPFGTFTFSRRP